MQIICLIKRIGILMLLGLTVTSFATDEQNQTTDDVYDPFEKINRKIFIVNSVLDHIILRPIAIGYTKVVPGPLSNKIENFIENFYTPLTFANNILQLDFPSAIRTLWKFTFNSTFGIFGFFNLTEQLGLEFKKQNFGATLAHYGAKPGPYLMLPILGGTNLRDVWDGLIIEARFNPTAYWVPEAVHNYGIIPVLNTIDTRAKLLPVTENIGRTSLDPYVTLRSMLYQKRANELKGR